ncbi:hypothetical protein RQP46_008732 [Phenoliferia psychrophenolica]
MVASLAGQNPVGIDLYSRFALAGALGCAITHGALTPVDVVKTRIQLSPEVYNKGMITGFRQIIKAEGAGALLTGLGPTILGYSFQGALKFGGYEFWKKTAIDMLGEQKARENRQAIYLGASGIAEFFADVALCPLEAVRIRLVSQPTFANGLLGGFARIAREEGIGGFYAGFGPILFKQVPYTMAKFAVFEVVSEKIIAATGIAKADLSSGQQTSINLGAGLTAGLAAAVISQPADTLLSKINKTPGAPGEGITSRLVGMARTLGPAGLFTGLGARLFMVGTLTAGQFMIYGDIKKLLGATGGAEISKMNAIGLFQSLVNPSALMPQLSLGGVSASVLDDAKAKAKEIESQAKDAASAAGGKVEQLKDSAIKELKKDSNKVKSAASGGIVLFSGEYYATCALGGILACGTTHALVTPLDLVKCRKQVDKNIYKSNTDGWSKIVKNEGGFRALYTGVGPTLLGYSMQGAAKYGFYEYFKKTYADMAGPENAIKYKNAIYLAGSASAEFFADMALVPMETVKVRMQTTFPPFATGIVSGVNAVVAKDGAGALFKSLPKFASFEATVAKIYEYLGKPKESYNKVEQLGVSATAGYIAGVFCAVVSHPADTMVSKLNAPDKVGVAKPTVGSIYSEIGFAGLWGGLGTRIIMIGTLTALQWLIYDSFKVYMGLPTTGSAAPAADAK